MTMFIEATLWHLEKLRAPVVLFCFDMNESSVFDKREERNCIIFFFWRQIGDCYLQEVNNRSIKMKGSISKL